MGDVFLLERETDEENRVRFTLYVKKREILLNGYLSLGYCRKNVKKTPWKGVQSGFLHRLKIVHNIVHNV